jgi:hypothetical protein
MNRQTFVFLVILIVTNYPKTLVQGEGIAHVLIS